MAKKTKPAVDKSEAEKPEAAVVDNERGASSPEESAPAAAPEEVKKGKKTSFDVYNRDNSFVRTYSVEQHGKDAEANAEEYAGKIGGSVK